ncbi:MAG TPA: LysR substrate-binding domain-containing protein [Burkholderiales bacterium]|nr:LysR substrate-binding domain-containing protein [Burkholderiales bacterium]
MDLTALHIFKTVAEAGGITKAAARLHRVQSNVTTRVKQLEEDLGRPLFHRRKRRLVLSAEGKLLLAYADRLLRLSSEAEAALRGGAPRGVLRIGSLESTAATRLPRVLSRYHLACPEVRIELVTGTTGALVERVLHGDIEAAFVAEPFTAEGLESLHVFTEELVLITPRGYARKLGHTPVLAFTTGCSYRRRLEAWLGRSGIAPERVMEYGSYHAIVACAAAGSGIAIVPRSVLRSIRTELQVELRPLPRDVAIAKTQLVWREGHQSNALEALVRQLPGSTGSADGSPGRRNAGARPQGRAVVPDLRRPVRRAPL